MLDREIKLTLNCGMNAIFVIQFMITDFMYIKAEHEKIYINALAHEHCYKKGILVGPKVLLVASQTVLLHILGSRGSHIFLQIDQSHSHPFRCSVTNF